MFDTNCCGNILCHPAYRKVYCNFHLKNATSNVYSFIFVSVSNVNSSFPEVDERERTVRVVFNEDLFVNSVRVMFFSNCTESVTNDYNNPVVIAIPNTGMNTGQCQYSIQLVDSRARPIGYPVRGFFEVEGETNLTLYKINLKGYLYLCTVSMLVEIQPVTMYTLVLLYYVYLLAIP